MATRTDSKKDSANSVDSMESNSDDKYEDVVLIVEGKKITANSGILAYSSPVFATLLRDSSCKEDSKVFETERHINMKFPTSRYEFRSDASKAVQTSIDRPIMELVIPEYKFKDIKKTLSYLVDKNGKRPMSEACAGQTETAGGAPPWNGETAWRLLPIAEEYKVKVVKKKCGDSLLKSLMSMREENRAGSISTKTVLKYLACAEKYGFNKMKTFCIDECAANFSVTRRKDIVDDKHILEMTKIKILDKMCETANIEYEKRLEQMQAENDQRFSEVKRKLTQQRETTDNWKEDTKHEVDAILSEAKKAHSKLVETLEKKNILTPVEEQVSQLSEDVMYDIGVIKDELQRLVESMADVKATVEETTEEASDLVQYFQNFDEYLKENEGLLEASIRHMNELANNFKKQITAHLRKCDLDQIETSLANNFDLQDSFDRLAAENIAKQRELSDAQLIVETEQLHHEKTKAELRKYTKKVSKVNTWIKWATPVEKDEDKCLCFRHVSLRSARQ